MFLVQTIQKVFVRNETKNVAQLINVQTIWRQKSFLSRYCLDINTLCYIFGFAAHEYFLDSLYFLSAVDIKSQCCVILVIASNLFLQ